MGKGIAKYQVNEVFEGFALVKSIGRGIARNDNPFLTVKIGDTTGELEMKIWNDVDEFEVNFPTESIIKVKGTISEFRGKKQLNLQNVRLSTEEDNISIADLLESAPIDGETLFERLKSTATDITNEKIKSITLTILEKYKEDLKVYPAARSNHHAYASGLAFHTSGMLDVAKELCKLYPLLNENLLYAGVILHDIGKIREYSGVVATESTFEGKLIGHISMINEEIGLTAKELGIEGEEVTLLQHLVLSHHGKLEWGSPVQPMIPEAEILHLIDMIDARMDTLGKALGNVEPGQFTERLFGMGNREYYKPKL